MNIFLVLASNVTFQACLAGHLHIWQHRPCALFRLRYSGVFFPAACALGTVERLWTVSHVCGICCGPDTPLDKKKEKKKKRGGQKYKQRKTDSIHHSN